MTEIKVGKNIYRIVDSEEAEGEEIRVVLKDKKNSEKTVICLRNIEEFEKFIEDVKLEEENNQKFCCDENLISKSYH